MPEDAPLTEGSPHVEPQPSQDSVPVTFKQVLQDELAQIAESRRARGVSTSKPTADNLIGLAFSGGGIRSATFNLGIMQALAENELLHKFDYLSTVSGGGYIGSWLAALTRRFLNTLPGSSFQDVERALVPGKRELGQREERTFLRWLRLYSNYLTPHTGLLSGDTWAMIGTWLRNVFLNQTVLGLLFLSVFVSCHGVLLGLLKSSRLHPGQLLFAGCAAWFSATVSLAWNVAEQTPSRQMLLTPFQRIKVTVTVILPFFLACLLLNFGLWRWTELADSPLWMWFAAGGVLYFLAWAVTSVPLMLLMLWREKHEKKGQDNETLSLSAFLFSSLIAGAVGGGLGWGYLMVLKSVPPSLGAYWLVAVLGTGAVMLIVLLAGALHLGLAGRSINDFVSEFWTRLSGYLMLLTLAWMLLAGALVFGPLLVRWVYFKLQGWSIVPVALWVLFTLTVVRAARSGSTGKESTVPLVVRVQRFWTDLLTLDGEPKTVLFVKIPQKLLSLLSARELCGIIASVGPYIYGIGVFLLVATLVHIGSGLFFDRTDTLSLWHLSNNSVWSFCCKLPPAATPGNDWSALSYSYWKIQWAGSPPQLLSVGIALAIASLWLSRRVGVNEFSSGYFHYVRLVRYFLAASSPARMLQPFTGCDRRDDLPLNDFAGRYPGPYPILNATLNTISGKELGYATRHVNSFVFTPLYCGYDLIFPGEGQDRFRLENAYQLSFSKTKLGARITSEGGITLGMAMAISGAEANRNQGYHASRVTSIFMTLFDVRRGWWMGNSRYMQKWQSAGPTSGLGYLLSELVGQSDQNKGYVYLSDGGHFDNLGLYELIKRHCRLIVFCDAECDGQYEFADLIALIEKARTDLGARIEIDFSKIGPKDGHESEYNFTVGDIFYDPHNPDDRGKLFCIKTSMPTRPDKSAVNQNSLPDDVWRYSEKHRTFPHQSTADEWFDELQFESYRALGQHIGRVAAAEIGLAIETALG
jgi:hypothetical protein